MFKLYTFVFQNALALVNDHGTGQLTTGSAVKMRDFVFERLIGHAKHIDSMTSFCDAPVCLRTKKAKNIGDCCEGSGRKP